MRNVWPWVVYSVPFSKGHTPPRTGRGVDNAVGVVVFKDPVELLEEETKVPVGVPEEVVLVIPLEPNVEELDTVGPNLEGPVLISDDAVEFTETTGGLEEIALPGVTLEVGRGD